MDRISSNVKKVGSVRARVIEETATARKTIDFIFDVHVQEKQIAK